MIYPKTVYIHTIGCQMNVYDSERIAGGLMPLGYRQISEPESADLVILNTCAIREKAEQKVFSFLGRMAGLKRKNPELLIGVGGCVAQQEGRKILDRAPYLDVVFGTHAVSRLPALIHQVETTGGRLVDVALSNTIQESPADTISVNPDQISRFVTIMQGCDNYCTYCVVPHVRGREMSRSPDRILSEIKTLAESGIREVTLLGQNVNSYGKKEGLCDFSELLTRVNGIDGLLRIRFTTSHPQDMSETLIEAIASTDNICKYIHLPVQSGSDGILAAMNRTYTTETYLRLVEKIRHSLPGVGLTTDIISGFPGETDADHRMTVALMQQVQYDGAYTFKYSPREHTKAWEMGDTVPEEIKGERVTEIVGIQQQISLVLNRRLIGSVQRVLVEGPSRKSDQELMGRTDTNKTVIFARGGERPGEYVDVHITRTNSATLFGSRCAAADAAEDAA